MLFYVNCAKAPGAGQVKLMLEEKEAFFSIIA